MGARTVLARVPGILEDADLALPDLLRQTLALVVDEIRALEARITTIDRQLARVAAEHPVAQRLQQIPGVGVLTATALVGAVNHIHAFRRGREFASWLGLTPRESSTGGRRYLGRH
jgi:transposase